MGYGIYTNPRFPTDFLITVYQSAQAIPGSLGPGEIVQIGSGVLPAGLTLNATLNTITGRAVSTGDYDLVLEKYDTVGLVVVASYPYTMVVLDIQIKIDGVSGNPTTDTIFSTVSHSFSLAYTGSYTPDLPSSFSWASLGQKIPAGEIFAGGTIANATLSGRPREAGQFYLDLQATDDVGHIVRKLFWIQSNYAAAASQDVPDLLSVAQLGSSTAITFNHPYSAKEGYVPYSFLNHDKTDWSGTNPAPDANVWPWLDYSTAMGLASGDLSCVPYIQDQVTQRMIVKDRVLQIAGAVASNVAVKHTASEALPRSVTTDDLYYASYDYTSPTNWYIQRYLNGTATLVASLGTPGVEFLFAGKTLDTNFYVICRDALDSNFEVKRYSKSTLALASTHTHGKGSATTVRDVVSISNYGLDSSAPKYLLFFDAVTASGRSVVSYLPATNTFTAITAFATGKDYVAVCVTDLQFNTSSNGVTFVWVVNKTDGTLIKYDPYANSIAATYSLPGGFSLDGMAARESIAVWKSSYLLLTDSGQNKIYRFNRTTAVFDSPLTGFAKPSQVFVDSHPHHPQTYVLNQGSNTITVLDDAFTTRYTVNLNCSSYIESFPDGGTKTIRPVIHPGSIKLEYNTTTGTATVTDTFTSGTSGTIGAIGTINYATGAVIVTLPPEFVAGSAKITYDTEVSRMSGLVSKTDYKLSFMLNGNANVAQDRTNYIDTTLDTGDPTWSPPSTLVLSAEQGFSSSQIVFVDPINTYTYSLLSGTVPPGMAVTYPCGGDNDTICVEGTPTTPGTYVFTIKLTPPNVRETALWISGSYSDIPL